MSQQTGKVSTSKRVAARRFVLAQSYYRIAAATQILSRSEETEYGVAAEAAVNMYDKDKKAMPPVSERAFNSAMWPILTQVWVPYVKILLKIRISVRLVRATRNTKPGSAAESTETRDSRAYRTLIVDSESAQNMGLIGVFWDIFGSSAQSAFPNPLSAIQSERNGLKFRRSMYFGPNILNKPERTLRTATPNFA